MSVEIIIGDSRDQLATLPGKSVHCCVSSPPYFGLRDYGHAGQMGLEATPEEFVSGMVEVFREVRRVLRDDGTLWLVIGDSYSGSGKGGNPEDSKWKGFVGNSQREASATAYAGDDRLYGLKPKNLIGIPWLLAFALRADGWYLRQDIIWAKPNPMPESVQDRCTKAHEYLFLLSKSPRYYFDAEAIAEPALQPVGSYETATGRFSQHKQAAIGQNQHQTSTLGANHGDPTRNKRSVWTVATQPFSEAHFATFPPELIEPCILAGCPESVCSACGAPWVRQVERTAMVIDRSERTHDKGQTRSSGTMLEPATTKTLGFAPSCDCHAPKARGTVLDPFFGAGTTGLVADRLQRNCIGIELNPEYAEMARRRIDKDRGGLLDAMEAA